MILPDINLLIYAYNSAAPWHVKAKAWWEGLLSGREPVGLAPAVALGFIRLLSSPRVVTRPAVPAALASAVQDWLDTGVVRLLAPGLRHFTALADLSAASLAGSALVTDLHLAVLAREHEAVLHTNDTDFQRFPGLRLFNPLA